MSILNQTSIIYVDQSYAIAGRIPIVAEIWTSDENDLPAATYFAGYNLCTGSKALCANGDIYGYDGTQWVYQEKSPYKDVYSKSQIDNMLGDIQTDIDTIDDSVTALQTSDITQDKYLYALIGLSPLNYIDSSVWQGVTPSGNGYICQDMPITLPAGSYVWKMQRDGNSTTSFVIRAADHTELYRVTRGAGVNDITQPFTISETAAKISIYAGYSVTYSDNMIFAQR